MRIPNDLFPSVWEEHLAIGIAISRARSTGNRIYSLSREDKDTTNRIPQMCTLLQGTIILTARWDSLALKGLCHELNIFLMTFKIIILNWYFLYMR
jgi:hypothetical protein